MGGKWRFLWLALIPVLLTGCDMPQVTVTNVDNHAQVAKQTEEILAFPYSLPESPLIVESMHSYSGAFWEDGSGETVENVAALMICNPTDRMVEFASFAAEQAGQTLYFFVYALPPQSRCLVQEYTRKCGDLPVSACRQLCIRWGDQELSRERIDYLGVGTSLTIINRDERQLDCVTVSYRQYVAQGDYYLGGGVQSVRLFGVAPEERRTVWPEHYDAAHARIVGIE